MYDTVNNISQGQLHYIHEYLQAYHSEIAQLHHIEDATRIVNETSTNRVVNFIHSDIL